MSDIVELCRASYEYEDCTVCGEAAAEIERLRACIAELESVVEAARDVDEWFSATASDIITPDFACTLRDALRDLEADDE